MTSRDKRLVKRRKRGQKGNLSVMLRYEASYSESLLEVVVFADLLETEPPYHFTQNFLPWKGLMFIAMNNRLLHTTPSGSYILLGIWTINSWLLWSHLLKVGVLTNLFIRGVSVYQRAVGRETPSADMPPLRLAEVRSILFHLPKVGVLTNLFIRGVYVYQRALGRETPTADRPPLRYAEG